MRANRSSLWPAFLVAPLLGACGDQTIDNTVPSSITLPPCLDGQLLGTDATGKLECRLAPVATLTPMVCAAGQALTSTDGINVSCVTISGSSLDQTILTRTDTSSKSVTDLRTKVTMAQMGTGGAKSTYIGSTDTPTVGQITFTAAAGQPPVDNGIPAATAQCNQKYMGSHMCSVYEMYDSLAGGVLKSGTAVPRAWLYMVGWNFPMAIPPLNSDTNNAGGPQEGTAENCGGYTYKTANRKWTGTAVEYAKLQTGDWGLKFHAGAASGTAGTAAYEPGAPCNQPLPIACCK